MLFILIGLILGIIIFLLEKKQTGALFASIQLVLLPMFGLMISLILSNFGLAETHLVLAESKDLQELTDGIYIEINDEEEYLSVLNKTINNYSLTYKIDNEIITDTVPHIEYIETTEKELPHIDIYKKEFKDNLSKFLYFNLDKNTYEIKINKNTFEQIKTLPIFEQNFEVEDINITNTEILVEN